MMRKVKSCGFLVLRKEPQLSFLLMKHPHRYDLPKGHIEAGETELQCALRELHEETGITADQIRIDPDFRYTLVYHLSSRRHGGEQVEKTLVVFLAFLEVETTIITTEHPDFEWVKWAPPHQIQFETIDSLLHQVSLVLNSIA